LRDVFYLVMTRAVEALIFLTH